MKLGTHMSDGERRKLIDIEVCRTKVKVLKHSHKRARNRLTNKKLQKASKQILALNKITKYHSKGSELYNQALSIHMFATRLSHLWCVTDFFCLPLRNHIYTCCQLIMINIKQQSMSQKISFKQPNKYFLTLEFPPKNRPFGAQLLSPVQNSNSPVQ